MNTRLVLELDKTIIDFAKQYAQNHNQSLSGLIENYFKNLYSDYYDAPKKHSPIVESLTGVLSENDLTKFAKEDNRAHYILTKKYE